MTLPDDTDTFLLDFGVPVIAGSVSGLGILNQPDDQSSPMGISTEYSVTVKTSLFGDLVFNDTIEVDEVDYTVRETRKMDDGKFCRILLTKT